MTLAIYNNKKNARLESLTFWHIYELSLGIYNRHFNSILFFVVRSQDGVAGLDILA